AASPDPPVTALPPTTAAPTVAAAPPPSATSMCPRVPLLAHPVRVRPELPSTQEGHCGRATSTPGVERVPYGRSIDDALYCLDALYEGPDGLPLDRMLEAALEHLTRVFSSVRVTAGKNAIAISARGRTLSIAPVHDVPSLAVAMVRVAELARSVVPASSISELGSPEHVLLRGATAALAWGADFMTPAGTPMPPPPRAPSASERVEQQNSQQILSDDIAYVKLVHFTRGAAAGLRQALAQRRRWRGVILDLRGSSGGLLVEALSLADVFLHRGCVAITVGSAQAEAVVARDQPFDSDSPLVILTDRWTASGAELLAATLQANNRAVIVGEKTFGKGVINVLMDVDGGGQISVPIAELLPGDGQSFNGHGLDPDILGTSAGDAHSSPDPTLTLAVQALRDTAKPPRRR
ncbi:MAG: C-terminal processing peptidase-2, partial [Myxococcales bacterium]|nr:C-terminal processing peptidase-2 [Myxococcales bacterium]